MNLAAKKELAARTFGVGKERIAFVVSRADEIKEAITKQDIRDLKKDGAILVKEIKGKKKVVKRKKKTPGNVKKKVNKRKQEYVAMTRKLREHTKKAKKQGRITPDESKNIRNKIRNRAFKSKARLNDYIGGLRK